MYADPVSGPAATAGEDREDDVRSFLVYLDSVQVDFDGFLALDISSFGVREDELRVIIGPNGAGKTTLCDVISGKTLPSSGRVFFDGNDITTMPDDEIARLGVGRKFQTPTVFDSLTVFENMELSLPGKKGIWRSLLSRQSAESRDHIMSLLERVRL
ncbi:MAG: ATP-binding cassette domain-containing protein, partial [Planctomycetota bacterium]|nr:ATP-binding cassette domain-containing protein [Planctomycetota bacterium]